MNSCGFFKSSYVSVAKEIICFKRLANCCYVLGHGNLTQMYSFILCKIMEALKVTMEKCQQNANNNANAIQQAL